MKWGVDLQLHWLSLFILPNSVQAFDDLKKKKNNERPKVGIRNKTVKVFIPYSRLQLMRTAMKKERCV